jgi:TonB family protein
MTRFSFALAAALLSAPIAGPAPAQQPPARPSPAPAARPWQVDWGQYYCSLIRKPETGRPFATAFITTPGGTGTSIRLVPEAGQQAPGGIDSIVLMPAGTRVPVYSSDQLQREHMVVRSISDLPPTFREMLGAATELQLRTGARIRARVPLDGMPGALAALRQCSSAVSREWGIDEAALAALSRRPRSTNLLGLSWQDYPAAALRRATEGHVIARISVDARGHATECATVASSGSPEIDSTVCRVAMTRGRFEAALDAAGRPVAARTTFTAFFRLPQD